MLKSAISFSLKRTGCSQFKLRRSTSTALNHNIFCPNPVPPNRKSLLNLKRNRCYHSFNSFCWITAPPNHPQNQVKMQASVGQPIVCSIIEIQGCVLIFDHWCIQTSAKITNWASGDGEFRRQAVSTPRLNSSSINSISW